MPDTTQLASFYQDRPVLVTGGAGFIGSHLTDALVRLGARVRVLDDMSQGLESNLTDVRDDITFIRGSILDADDLRSAIDGVKTVFHQAARSSVPASIESPTLFIESNAVGTMGILEACRAHGVDRLVFAASSSAYGDQLESPKREDMSPDPLSPYAVSKCTGEQMLRAWSSCYDFSAVSLRYFNIFGPRQRPDSPYAAVIPLFARAFATGATPVIYGDGTQTRDFTHVTNAVHANLLAGASEKNLQGEVFNVACGHGTSLLELVEAVAKVAGADPVWQHDPPRVGEVQHSCADISRARDRLGYDVITPFDTGLVETVEWYLTAAKA